MKNQNPHKAHTLSILGLLLSLMWPFATAAAELDVPYGSNVAAGTYASVNGIKLYYESYGSGQPMLQIHGWGQSISALNHQIAFFSPHYKVIVADSRGHGKSEMGAGLLTHEQMADDLNALLETLNAKAVYVLGFSDGGILGLLLAIRHPDKVGKLAIMGANLNPEGLHDWALKWAVQQDQQAASMIAKGDTSQPWSVKRQLFDLWLKSPQIPIADLAKVQAPTLVMVGDKDIIRHDHTLQIFDNLPQAHLAIFPGATHMIPMVDHELFNMTVERFFNRPFTRPESKDLLK